MKMEVKKPRGVTAKTLVKRISSATDLGADFIFNYLTTVACPMSPNVFQPVITRWQSRVYLTKNELGRYQLVRAGSWGLKNGTIYDIWPSDRDFFYQTLMGLRKENENGHARRKVKKNGGQTCPRTNRRRRGVH